MTRKELKQLIREVIDENSGIPKKTKLKITNSPYAGSAKARDLYIGSDKIATIEDTGNQCEFTVYPSGRFFQLTGSLNDIAEYLWNEAVWMEDKKKWGISVKGYVSDFDDEDS